MLAAVPAHWLASPASFAVGVVVGLWIGARFDLRKKGDA